MKRKERARLGDKREKRDETGVGGERVREVRKGLGRQWRNTEPLQFVQDGDAARVNKKGRMKM